MSINQEPPFSATQYTWKLGLSSCMKILFYPRFFFLSAVIEHEARVRAEGGVGHVVYYMETYA